MQPIGFLLGERPGRPGLDAARTLAEALASDAPEREAAGGLPFAEVERLRQSGLLSLLVPQERGGLGGIWADAAAVTRVIAAADGSIGHLIGYHYLNQLAVASAGSAAQYAALEEELVAQRQFLGDFVNPLDPGLVVRQEGDTIILNGKRSFATGAAVADLVLVTFRLGTRDCHVLLPRDRQGFRPQDDWDNIGQRLTSSGSVLFERVAVAEAELLDNGKPHGAEATPADTLISAFIQATLANVLVGITAGALESAARYTKERSRPWPTSGVAAAADDPYILLEYGRMTARLAAVSALARSVADDIQLHLDRGPALTAEERAAASIAAATLKIETTTTALDVTAKVFELMGARATVRRFGYDRFWRDARTLSLHDPVSYKQREVGEYILKGKPPVPSTYS